MDLLKTKEIGPEDWSEGALCSQSKEEIGPGKHEPATLLVFLQVPQ